jgi:hypothetical protein
VTEATLSVDIVGVEFNLNGLPDKYGPHCQELKNIYSSFNSISMSNEKEGNKIYSRRTKHTRI